MARQTDTPSHVPADVAAFYDRLAADYDTMTGFEQRFVAETPYFRILVERYAIRSAVDAGCGTGFHSLLLAQLGVEVTAVDISPRMVETLGNHSREMNLPVRAAVGEFRHLPGIVPSPVDAVFCLGNTLAHMRSPADLNAAFSAFAQVLRPGGILFVQILNYDRILARREKVQNAKESAGTTFVRFYEYHRDHILFNILRLRKEGGVITHTLESVELHPILLDSITGILRLTGFTDLKVSGGITMEEYVPADSRDLVILARKEEVHD